jgi:hypothetical protein
MAKVTPKSTIHLEAIDVEAQITTPIFSKGGGRRSLGDMLHLSEAMRANLQISNPSKRISKDSIRTSRSRSTISRMTPLANLEKYLGKFPWIDSDTYAEYKLHERGYFDIYTCIFPTVALIAAIGTRFNIHNSTKSGPYFACSLACIILFAAM